MHVLYKIRLLLALIIHVTVIFGVTLTSTSTHLQVKLKVAISAIVLTRMFQIIFRNLLFNFPGLNFFKKM